MSLARSLIERLVGIAGETDDTSGIEVGFEAMGQEVQWCAYRCPAEAGRIAILIRRRPQML